MTELSEHARAILRAIADGKEIESKIICGDDKAWKVEPVEWTLRNLQSQVVEFRIKPETRSINGVEFFAPNNNEPYAYELRVNDAYFRFERREDGFRAAMAILDALNGVAK